jgi:hypothetical protein
MTADADRGRTSSLRLVTKSINPLNMFFGLNFLPEVLICSDSMGTPPFNTGELDRDGSI